MAVAAVWFGVTAALFERLCSGSSTTAAFSSHGIEDVVISLGRCALLDTALATVLLLVGTARLSLDGGRITAFVMIFLAALAGSSFTLALIRLMDRLVVALGAVVVLVIFMTLIGGPVRPLPRLNPVARSTTSLLPSRWAFEGLLLNWAGPRAEDAARDPVEPFFPAATDRAGTSSCVTALIAICLGAAYANAVSALSRSTREP